MPAPSRESKSAATIRRRHNKFIRPHRQSGSDNDENHKALWNTEQITGPPILKMLLSRERALFSALLAFRSINALIMQTSYVPDEYWQALEPAHDIVFGYGYLTWEWRKAIRGYLHPLLYAVPYSFLKSVCLDHRLLLIKVPRLVQAVLSAHADLSTYKLAHILGSPSIARWSLLCQLTSWFYFYCSVRTLSNSVEMTLTLAALVHYPWPSNPRARVSHWHYLPYACMAVLMRPTAAIVWLPLCAWQLQNYPNQKGEVVKASVITGSLCLMGSMIVDRIFYDRWVFVQYNFFHFNVLSGSSAFYGSHPWHWYISQGFPAIMGPHLLLFMPAVVKGHYQRPLLCLILWVTLVYSLLSHKEFRFIFPILPLAMIVCGTFLNHLTTPHEGITSTSTDQSENSSSGFHSEPDLAATNGEKTGSGSGKKSQQTRQNTAKHMAKYLLVSYLLITNLPIILYTSLIHQRGTLDVMMHIYDESRYQTKDMTLDILFLMPCHSTPYHSYIHKNTTMRFLTCEPNLLRKRQYVDEAEVFYKSPSKWLKKEFKKDSKFPSHLVMFDVLQNPLKNFTTAHDYQECSRSFHTHFPEGRVSSYVVVLCHKAWLVSKQGVKRRRMFLHMP